MPVSITLPKMSWVVIVTTMDPDAEFYTFITGKVNEVPPFNVLKLIKSTKLPPILQANYYA